MFKQTISKPISDKAEIMAVDKINIMLKQLKCTKYHVGKNFGGDTPEPILWSTVEVRGKFTSWPQSEMDAL